MINKIMQSPSQHDVATEEAEVNYQLQFTRDPNLIAQYKQLRNTLYGIDRRFVGFRMFNEESAENYEDPDDQMLIMHDNNRVYGGACLRVSTPEHPLILNSEQDVMPPAGQFYFSLREHFPDYELDKYAYCEFVRIAVDPVLRKGGAIRKLYYAALERCLEYRVRYMFGIADRIRARLYHQIYTNAGMEGRTLNTDIPMRPEYEDLKMHLICIDMKKSYVTPQDPDAACLLKPLDDFRFY
jgi:GNAT superfamily N-acetyltransferase